VANVSQAGGNLRNGLIYFNGLGGYTKLSFVCIVSVYAVA